MPGLTLELLTPHGGICTNIYIVTILPLGQADMLKGLGLEQRLEQDIFVGPSGAFMAWENTVSL